MIALLAIPDGGREWGRFTLITLIAGCESPSLITRRHRVLTVIFDSDPYFHPIMTSWISENSFSVKKRSISVATYNIVVQWGAIVGKLRVLSTLYR